MIQKMSFSPAESSPALSRRFSVAPMMDWTDRHCRFFLRLLSKNALLYTEMVTTGALLNGDAERFLRHAEAEHPLALQLGGSTPADLAACAQEEAAMAISPIHHGRNRKPPNYRIYWMG